MRYVVICMCFCTVFLVAQTSEWAVRYDGPANAADVGLAIAVDVHGRYARVSASGWPHRWRKEIPRDSPQDQADTGV